jgi:hypothetical protein
VIAGGVLKAYWQTNPITWFLDGEFSWFMKRRPAQVLAPSPGVLIYKKEWLVSAVGSGTRSKLEY